MTPFPLNSNPKLNWNYYGMNYEASSAKAIDGMEEDKRVLFNISLPFWLSIGPICWEGKYS